MPRARRITPEFWLDRELSKLSERTRLLYIGIWNFADCNGIIEYDAEMIRVQVFPYKNLNIENNLNDLIKLKKLITFEVNEKKYLWVKNFKKYQYLKKPNYRFPIPSIEVLSQYPTSVPPVDPQYLKKPKPKPKPKYIKNPIEKNGGNNKKPYWNGCLMAEVPVKSGKWRIFENGEWKDYGGSLKEIVWK
ncbi:MAG: hypothetical protein PHT54_03470 [Candidatus Nanoarchaeia archaeon]|nr:hypothetical protein [Candidatus Nanoarchaeia archaeon]